VIFCDNIKIVKLGGVYMANYKDLYQNLCFPYEDGFDKKIEFILEIDKMKSTYRKNINLDGNNEDDAQHSFMIAVMAMIFKDYAFTKDIDFDKAVKLCLVHDLIEVYAGDTFCWDEKANESKKDREIYSANKLFSLLPMPYKDEIRALWEEFDECATNEAKYANAIDRIQPFILNLNTGGHTWKLAHPKYSQMMKRFSIVKDALPSLWGFILKGIDNGIKNGFVIDDRT
jgi:putative hydrolase of HD superfamily